MTLDKELIATRFARAATTYDDEADVQKLVARRLLALLHEHADTAFRDILEIGCGTGHLSRLLLTSLAPQRLVLNDLCPRMLDSVRDLTGRGVEFRAGDGETGYFGTGFDLVISSSVVQWFCDPARFVASRSRILKPGGCLALATYGPENMREISALTGMGLEYKSLRQWTALLGDSWQVAVATEHILHKTFATPMDVLNHLRRTGVTGTGRYRWTATKLRDFLQQYSVKHSRDGCAILTYHPLYIVARKRF